MKAAWYLEVGPAKTVLRLGEHPVPEVPSGGVLVNVCASGVNPSDVKRRAGWLNGLMEYPEIIPHSDGAGVIMAVGDKVSNNRVGERVWVYNGQWERPMGTAAEYIVLPSDQAVHLHDNVGFIEGACLGVPACTAYHCVASGGDLRGQQVLVQGGAGAVGGYAIQIAVLSGAQVIATCSTKEKADLALAMGAAVTINYKSQNVVEAVMAETHGKGVQHIVEVDFGQNAEIDAAVIKSRGSIASYSSTLKPRVEYDYYGFGYKGASIEFVQVYLLSTNERLGAVTHLNQWMAGGALTHCIGYVSSLEDIAQAHEAQESGQVIGNIVLDLEKESVSV